MTEVFVDTVGLLALWDEDDQWHSEAQSAWTTLLASSPIFYTTPFVLAECGNAASRQFFRGEVAIVRQDFEDTQTLLWPTASEWEQAWRSYTLQKPGAPGIVDHISFIVMRRLGITDVFSNDRHFKAAGFNTLF